MHPGHSRQTDSKQADPDHSKSANRNQPLLWSNKRAIRRYPPLRQLVKSSLRGNEEYPAAQLRRWGRRSAEVCLESEVLIIRRFPASPTVDWLQPGQNTNGQDNGVVN